MGDKKMNILHLSDIHFGRNYPEYGIKDAFEKKDKILEDLISCIANIEDGLRPEHVVVTGDIAWRGKKKDFDEAYEWFTKLLSVIGLQGKDITFCVGNHDVNRSYACSNRDLKDDDIEKIDNIYAYENVHEMEPPIYEYDKFCEKIGMVPYLYPLNGKVEYSYSLGYKDVEFPSGSTIRIFAFNTALISCLPNIDDDRMWIGQNQILELMKYGIMPLKKDDVSYYKIALFHHAERFLHPNEICEYNGRVATLPLLKDAVDLILCGHTETGGRPVLQEQAGGGKLLTGGAAYYSDKHPNAFSMIYIADNKTEMCFAPYTFDEIWKRYEYKTSRDTIKDIATISEIGDLKEQCQLVVKNDKREYVIPLKKVSVFEEDISGDKIVHLDNRKEVLRDLNIDCSAPAQGGTAKFNITLAPKMEFNIKSMLKREECFEAMADLYNCEDETKMYVQSESGEIILSGDNFKCNLEVDRDATELLRKIVMLEDYFDIKLRNPYDIYENELKRMDILLQIIEYGYTTNLKLGKSMMVDISDRDKLDIWYEEISQNNNFFIRYSKEFMCELFENVFSLGNILICAGPYHMDKVDFEYKRETFRAGDVRKGVLNADEKFTTYFIKNPQQMKSQVLSEYDCKVIDISNANLDFGFIYEKESKSNSEV